MKLLNKRFIISAVAIALCITSVGCQGKKPIDIGEKDVRNINNFSAKTAEVLLAGTENSCYSPVSLYMSMCTSAELANDETRKMLLEALGYKTLEEMENAHNEVVKSATGTNNSEEEIIIADSLWIQEGYLGAEGKKFIEERKINFDMNVFIKDYTDDEINKWVEDVTKGLIKSDYSSGELSAMRLINTIYFDAKWNMPFTSSINGEFKTAAGGTRDVNFMSAPKETMQTITADNYTAIKKMYKGGASMILVAPGIDVSLQELVTEETIKEILETYYDGKSVEKEVILKMPRFDIEKEYEKDELEKALENVGINGLFKREAWNKLVVTDEIDRITPMQNTHITVFEEGTKVAAVTSIDFIKKSPDETLKITLDKPFMYIVEKEGVPLFIGTVYNPQ